MKCAAAGCRVMSKLKKCSKCTIVYYCSPSCQRTHWKIHKKTCIPMDHSTAGTAPGSGPPADTAEIRRELRIREYADLPEFAQWGYIESCIRVMQAESKGAGDPI